MSDTKIEELYSLKWNSHMSNFLENFIEHQQENSLVDVTLSCEGQYIQTHKLILASCSTYFDHLFQTHKDEQRMFVVLYGVRMRDLRIILYFMYHGEVKIPHTELDNVVRLARSLGIKGLSSVVLEGDEDVKKEEPKQVNDTKQEIIEPKRTQSVDNSKKMPNIMKMPTPVKRARKSPPKATPTPPKPPTPPVFPAKPKTVQPNGESQPVRPPHAFTLFANVYRNKLMAKHPGDNSREISQKLSNLWKNLPLAAKNQYYTEAQKQAKFFGKRVLTPAVKNEPVKRKADVLKDSKKPSLEDDPIQNVEPDVQIELSDSD